MSKGKFALGALFGALSGFVAGVLTAPKSGKETRDELKATAQKKREEVMAESGKVKTVATEKAQEVRTKAEEVVGDVKAKTEEVIEDVTEKATEFKGRAEQAIEGAKKGFAKKPTTKK